MSARAPLDALTPPKLQHGWDPDREVVGEWIAPAAAQPPEPPRWQPPPPPWSLAAHPEPTDTATSPSDQRPTS